MRSYKEADVHPAHVFAGVGVIFTFASFWIYNRRDGKINTATWSLWVIGDTLEAGSFFVMTGQDAAKNAIPIAFALGSFATFMVAIAMKRFGLPDGKDRAVMAVDIVITTGWWQQFMTAVTANVLFVSTEIISFIPLYRGILLGKEHEESAPFLLWTAADLAFLATVLSLPHTFEEIVYPIVAALAHLLVVLCIMARKTTSGVPH